MSRCANCGKRKGTLLFGGGALDILHGGGAMWCEVCVLTKQIAHAEERALALPELKRRLAEIEAAQ